MSLLILAAAMCAAPVNVGTGPVRAALLEAVRGEVSKDLKQAVRFRVTTLRTCGDWAYALVTPETPEGKPIDFAKTHHAERIEEGVFDGPGTYALLAKGKAGWTVKAFAIGPTDVVWMNWVEEYKLPEALFE
jgi:hypothetical protein